MSLAQLFAQHAAPAVGPSPYRALFLREQVCNVPVRGLVLRRVFIGV